MKSYRLTETADEHLQEIWRYTRDRWGAAQASAYLAEIEKALVARFRRQLCSAHALNLAMGWSPERRNRISYMASLKAIR